MRPGVNLLPPELAQERRARRTAAITAAGVGVYALVLGGVYLLQLGDVADARAERDEAQEEVAARQRELAELRQFAELAAQLDARNALLANALATEISWASVLNNLSLSFPASSSLLTLNATTTEGTPAGPAGAPVTPETGAQPEGEVETPPVPVATITFTGYSVEEYAPGVETVLLQLDDVATFFNAYLATAARVERGPTEVTNFDGAVQLDDEAYTGRYAEGLPPEGVQ
jgi:Tfp pilus assembly protein PilN